MEPQRTRVRKSDTKYIVILWWCDENLRGQPHCYSAEYTSASIMNAMRQWDELKWRGKHETFAPAIVRKAIWYVYEGRRPFRDPTKVTGVKRLHPEDRAWFDPPRPRTAPTKIITIPEPIARQRVRPVTQPSSTAALVDTPTPTRYRVRIATPKPCTPVHTQETSDDGRNEIREGSGGGSGLQAVRSRTRRGAGVPELPGHDGRDERPVRTRHRG